VVAIGGDDEKQITEGLKLIMDQLKDSTRRSMSVFYDPVNRPSEVFGNGISGKIQNSLSYSQSDFLQVQTETKITVNNVTCGAIIGKGGAKIREIKMNSGAKIEISQSDTESKEDNRIITITEHKNRYKQQSNLWRKCCDEVLCN